MYKDNESKQTKNPMFECYEKVQCPLCPLFFHNQHAPNMSSSLYVIRKLQRGLAVASAGCSHLYSSLLPIGYSGFTTKKNNHIRKSDVHFQLSRTNFFFGRNKNLLFSSCKNQKHRMRKMIPVCDNP